MGALILLDFDDTLLCSTHVLTKSVRASDLKDLAVAVIAILEGAMKLGDVVIITNGEDDWVRKATAKYMPSTVKLFQRIRVISARDNYSIMFPNSPMKWKYLAFQRLLMDVTPQHVLSLGDSLIERRVTRILGRGRSWRTKTVKFATSPTPVQLQKQLELVTSSLSYLCTVDSNLDLQLKIIASSPNVDPDLLPGQI